DSRIHYMVPKLVVRLFRPILSEGQLYNVIAEVIGKEDPNNLVTKQGQESKRLGLLVKDLDLVDSTQSDSYFSSQRISHMSSSSYRSAIDELRKGICKVETIDIVLNASDVLTTALDMKLLLRINVKSSNLSGNENVYNVTKACHDEHLIHKYSASVNEQLVEGLKNVTSLDCTTDFVYLGDDESIRGGQESINESKTVISGKGRAKRIDVGIIGVIVKDLESIPIGQLSSTKKPRL
ncbi:hypothetical protein S245_051463, partial [Arachis hypogaea]